MYMEACTVPFYGERPPLPAPDDACASNLLGFSPSPGEALARPPSPEPPPEREARRASAPRWVAFISFIVDPCSILTREPRRLPAAKSLERSRLLLYFFVFYQREGAVRNAKLSATFFERIVF